METYPTLFEVERREVPKLPSKMKGENRTNCGYTHTSPREWTEDEVGFMRDLFSQGYTLGEVAESLGRSETSIAIKLKRIGKRNERYNEPHRAEKYEANEQFFNTYRPRTILDLYCGTSAWWMHNAEGASVYTNDIDAKVEATSHRPAEKLIAEMYAKDLTFDLIDLDPFGSAYDCFDLALRMAQRCIVVTFGEMGHKRWKRLDFVRRYYGIDNLSDFTTARLIEEFRRIGLRNKKDCIPVIVKEWPRISRVYFEIRKIKITEQWN